MSVMSTCNNKTNRNVVRLNKLIALKKNISRRKSEQYIKDGHVKLNNIVVLDPGKHVDVTKDRVIIDNCKVKIDKLLRRQIERYCKNGNSNYLTKWIVLHKPKGLICTFNDEKNRKNIFSLFPKDLLQKYRLVSVGRLDRNTSGVLLLTNEYEWVHKLTHPKFGRVRTYRVSILGGVNMSSLKKLSNGVYLDEDNTLNGGFKKERSKLKGREGKKIENETMGLRKEKGKEKGREKGKKTLPSFIEILREENINIKGTLQKTTVLNISVKEGRNRQIRKMFEHINQPVVKIKRIAFENITLKGVYFPKQYRELNQKEIIDLKKGSCK